MTEFVRYVAGMSCQHCVRTISTHVGDVPGVQTVEVSLSSGSVRVCGTGDLTVQAVDAAIVEAGYPLASAPSGAVS